MASTGEPDRLSLDASGDFGVGSWIERRARIAPDRPALVYGTRALTYAELAARIRRLAAALRGLGVAHGDRVGWIGSNHPAFLETLFAVGRLGRSLRRSITGSGRMTADPSWDSPSRSS